MRGSKVIAVCIFNDHRAVSLFLTFDGTSMRTDPFISGKKYRKLVNNAVFTRNESLFFVSAASTSVFQLEHMQRLLCGIYPGGYQIWTIEYGKILVMLVYGEYYGRVYEVYSYTSVLLLILKFYRYIINADYCIVHHTYNAHIRTLCMDNCA